MPRITFSAAAAITAAAFAVPALAFSAALLSSAPASAAEPAPAASSIAVDCTSAGSNDPGACAPSGLDATDAPVDVTGPVLYSNDPCLNETDPTVPCAVAFDVTGTEVGGLCDQTSVCVETLAAPMIETRFSRHHQMTPPQDSTGSQLLLLLVGAALGAAGLQVYRERQHDQSFR